MALFRSPGDDDPRFVDPSHDSRLPRNRELAPTGPRKFTVEKAGTGVRFSVYDWPHESIDSGGSGAIQFVAYWAETVDTSTEAGKAAGFARSIVMSPTIATAGNDARSDQPIVAYFADPKFQTGYFYLKGQSANGEMSEPVGPVHVDAGTGGAVPADVEHFVASESGVQDGQTTISVVSYSFRIPNGTPVLNVQFMYQNYPALNQLFEGESVRITAGRGSTQTGQLRLPPGRRKGNGTISIAGGVNVTGVGTEFLTLAAQAGGDQLEVYGVRGRIASVTDNLTMTLLDTWDGPPVTNVSDWLVIARVKIFAVSEGVGGARRDDPENAPSATVDFDGLLSEPIPPTLTLKPVGNAIRSTIDPGAGTELARCLLYRQKGTGLSFDKTNKSGWDMIEPFAIDNQNPTKSFQFDDSNFTVFNRENGEVFSYVATTVNARDMESDGSIVQEAAARLDAPADNSPTNPAREIALNQLWNGHINGTPGNTVLVGDVSQDVNMGGAPPAGRSRWYGIALGVASLPGHVNTNEVVLAMTNPVGGGTSSLQQDIGAVDNAVAANRRIPTWKMLHAQIKLRTSGGQPNGTLFVDVQQFNGAVLTATAGCVRRLSDDSIDISQKWLAVAGSDILTEPTLYHAAFVLDDTVVTTLITVRIYYQVTNWNGVNVFVRDAMLSLGEALPQYTPQMADPSITFSRNTGGAPSPPPSFNPDDGTGVSRQQLQIP